MAYNKKQCRKQIIQMSDYFMGSRQGCVPTGELKSVNVNVNVLMILYAWYGVCGKNMER